MNDIDYLKKYLKPSQLKNGIEKLKKGFPVQYIIGNVDFYGNIMKVNKDVLIPRFETEGLVEKTYNYLKNKKDLEIVDIGTGSGCIAITLKKLLNCKMDAVDISERALDVASENAKANKVEINFYLGDLLTPLTRKYDCIISNPPYIAENEKIMDIVKNNEPALALYASNNGLSFYEKIIKNSYRYLKDEGLLAFEIGHQQANKIKDITYKFLPKAKIIVEKDLSLKDRYIFIFL